MEQGSGWAGVSVLLEAPSRTHTCPHQQPAVGCHSFQNHSFIIKQKKATLSQHQGPSAIKATLHFAMPKTRTTKRTEENRQVFAGSSAVMSAGQYSVRVSKGVRKNSKYTKLSRAVRSCTLGQQRTSEAVSFCQKTPLHSFPKAFHYQTAMKF